MKLKQLGSNMSEIELGSFPNNTSILFSYSTPVAGYVNGEAFRTDKHYSPTTSKHINKYLGDDKSIARTVSQDYIDGLTK